MGFFLSRVAGQALGRAHRGCLPQVWVFGLASLSVPVGHRHLVAHTPSHCTIGAMERWVFLGVLVGLGWGCGGGASAPAAEPKPVASVGQEEGAEARAKAAAAEQEAAEEAAREAEREKALTEVHSSAMKLGVNVAALDQTLDAPRVDCDRAYKLSDHVCDLAQNMCGIAEAHEEAQGQCDRAQGKCERGKSDVAAQRCRRSSS